MGCNCIKYQLLESKTEFKEELNNNESISNSNYIITTNKQKKLEEIDTTILGYPEIVFNLINKIRTNPKDYANIIEESKENIVEEEGKLNVSHHHVRSWPSL